VEVLLLLVVVVLVGHGGGIREAFFLRCAGRKKNRLCLRSISTSLFFVFLLDVLLWFGHGMFK
jgi:hypothetical protein